MKKAGADIGLRSSVILRVVIATVLLGSGAVIYFEQGLRNQALFLVLIIAAVYLLSLFYLLFHDLIHTNPGIFKAIQITFDLLLASSVVFITGGRSSPFVFLYALIIIFAGVMLTRTASLVTAAVSGMLYLLMVLYQYFSDSQATFLSSSPAVLEARGVVYTYYNLAGFLLIAILGGYLAERIRVTRKELGESAASLSLLKNLHENILQSLTSGVITLDFEGKIISVNRTGLEILEIEGEGSVLRKELGSLMPGIEVTELLSKKREQILYTAPDGRKLTLGFSSSVLRDADEKMKGYIIIFQDLTNVKELEERLKASEKIALLGQLAAGLAHELRNPLSAISGSVEILSGEVVLTEENLRLVKVAAQEVERLNLLVEDFLLLTTPIERFSSFVDLGLIIRETAESFLRTMQRGGLEIVTNADKGLYVQADSYKLKQAFWNLLLNSMQAMPEGGKIVIESHLENDGIVVKVSDNGCGMDERIISRIFEPFFTTKEVGTGLGLAIVQRVVEGYNGKVDVISSKEEGATFIISLPLAKRVETVRNPS